jgi:alanine racemase
MVIWCVVVTAMIAATIAWMAGMSIGYADGFEREGGLLIGRQSLPCLSEGKCIATAAIG